MIYCHKLNKRKYNLVETGKTYKLQSRGKLKEILDVTPERFLENFYEYNGKKTFKRGTTIQDGERDREILCTKKASDIINGKRNEETVFEILSAETKEVQELSITDGNRIRTQTNGGVMKRFTETTKWTDTWFMNQPSRYKLFWLFLLDNCNHVGLWEVNFAVANFFVGEVLEPSEVRRILNGRIVEIEDGKYWFIPKFVTFQYGNELSGRNSAVRSVIKTLEKNNLYQYLDGIKVEETEKTELNISDMVKDYPSLDNDNFIETYEKWIKYRREIKKPMKLTTIKTQLKTLSNDPDPVETISKSIRNGWQGLFGNVMKKQYTKFEGKEYEVINGKVKMNGRIYSVKPEDIYER